MEYLLLILISVLTLLNLATFYFLFKNKSKQESNISEKISDQINSIKMSFTESFGSMSKDVAKDK